MLWATQHVSQPMKNSKYFLDLKLKIIRVKEEHKGKEKGSNEIVLRILIKPSLFLLMLFKCQELKSKLCEALSIMNSCVHRCVCMCMFFSVCVSVCVHVCECTCVYM